MQNYCKYNGVDEENEIIICLCNLNSINKENTTEENYFSEEDDGDFLSYFLGNINYNTFKCYKLCFLCNIMCFPCDFGS